MDRKTALSAAGALTLTAVAAVSALFFTMSAGADTANEPTTPVVAEPEVVTEYEVVQAESATDEGHTDATPGGEAHMDGEEYPEDGDHDHEEVEEYPEGDEMEGDEYPEDEDEDEDDDDEEDEEDD